MTDEQIKVAPAVVGITEVLGRPLTAEEAVEFTRLAPEGYRFAGPRKLKNGDAFPSFSALSQARVMPIKARSGVGIVATVLEPIDGAGCND